MTDAIGLDAAGRATVAAMLDQTLTAIGPAPDPQRAADITLALLEQVDKYAGPVGLFELAAACIDVITGGLRAAPESRMEYLGFGPTEISANPSTPTEYAHARFGTAIIGCDRDLAWRLWQPLSPGADEPVAQATADFLVGLIRNAWNRARGGDLMTVVRSDTAWPPVCDFCIGCPATCMWHVVGSDVRTPHPGGTGAAVLRLDDMEYWYACPTCRGLIARRQPQWDQVWARHRRFRRAARKPETVAMFRIFERPRIRPAPTPRHNAS